MRTPRDGFNRTRTVVPPVVPVPPGFVTPNMRSSVSHLQRLEQIRAEVADQIFQRRLMHMIKTEHELIQSHIQQKEAQATVEPDCDQLAKQEPKKKDPVPAFASIEDGVDFSWIYEPYSTVSAQSAYDEEREIEESSKMPGLVLIMTPILPEKLNEEAKVADENLGNVVTKISNLSADTAIKVSTKVSNFIVDKKKTSLIQESNVDDSDSDDESFTVSIISDSDSRDYEFM